MKKFRFENLKLSGSKQNGLWLFAASALIFMFVSLPSLSSIKQVKERARIQEQKSARAVRVAQILSQREDVQAGRSLTLVRFLEEAAKQLKLQERITQVAPSLGAVAFEINDVILAEALMLFSVIEEAPPVAKVSFLKIIPQNERADRFLVQVKLSEI